MTNFLSSFGIGGNPFSTTVGQQIESATDKHNASEDWAAFMSICDMINGTEDGPKDAVKAIKKRLHSSVKDFNVIMFSLTLLETCVKNCGHRFHVGVAQKDFLQEMIKVLAPKNEAPTVVQEKVLGLIQAWSEAFKGKPDLKEVERMYQELKGKGIEFPMINLDQAPPIHTPARSVVAQPTTQSPTQHLSEQQGHTHPGVYRPAGVSSSQPSAQHTRSSVGPEYFVKLREQLDTVEGNMRVFNEMMTELQAHSAPADDWHLMTELSTTCKQMQERIVVLLQQIQHEEVTGELLRINDELNNVFVRWERFARGRPNEEQLPAHAPQHGASRAPHPSAVPSTPPATRPVPQPVYPSPVSPGMAQVSSKPPNLIDLDDPVSTATAGVATLSVNNSDGRGDDFDTFAHSRTDQSTRLQHSYADQRQTDFASGLGAAMNARATGQSISDTADNYDEMEQWLKDNPEAGAPGAQPPTMTSTEFDRFLTERASAGENLPQASGDASRRRLQQGDEKDTMFAL